MPLKITTKKSLTQKEFAALLEPLKPFSSPVAVALSGGADSMALTLLLQKSMKGRVVALTVDHGLRKESAAEAQKVARWMKAREIEHHILRLNPPKKKTRLQENARAGRYALLIEKCRELGIADLFLAHHLDDQAETFLLRLAAGSGVDGLSCMAPQRVEDGVRLLRPLLGIEKERLKASCRKFGQKWVEDPSNVNEDFARIRLRAAAAPLAREGLTAERLSKTAQRMSRARSALEEMAEAALGRTVGFDRKTGVASLKKDGFLALPEEVRLRLLGRVLTQVGGQDGKIRLERLESLLNHMKEKGFSAATLGGCVIRAKKECFEVCREKSRALSE